MSVFDNEPFTLTEENETSNCKRKRTVPSVDEKHESQPNSKKTCYHKSLVSFVLSKEDPIRFVSELEKILSRVEKTMKPYRTVPYRITRHSDLSALSDAQVS